MKDDNDDVLSTKIIVSFYCMRVYYGLLWTKAYDIFKMIYLLIISPVPLYLGTQMFSENIKYIFKQKLSMEVVCYSFFSDTKMPA